MPTIESIMTRNLVTVGLETPAGDALGNAVAHHVRHLLVCDAGLVTGIACLCDLEGAEKTTPVSEVMSAPVVEAAPTLSLPEAATLMRDLDVSCLPVSVNGKPVGVVTRGDLTRAGYWPPTNPMAAEEIDACDAYYDLGCGD